MKQSKHDAERASQVREGLVALSGCVIARPPAFDGGIEIVTATPLARGFPTHVNEGLGVCLKFGSAHQVQSDGRAVTYPADALCVRHPGCVWSSEVASVGFLSIDVAPALLPRGLRYSPMRFVPASELSGLAGLAGKLQTSGLEGEQALAELLTMLFERGLLAADELRSSASNGALDRAREFLAAELEHNPSLEELARAAGLNKFVLIRHFKRRFGTTPHRYLISLRVERARALLARGASPVHVAAALGFADQGHLGRQFKRIVGVTPAEFARSVRKTAAPIPRAGSISFETRRGRRGMDAR